MILMIVSAARAEPLEGFDLNVRLPPKYLCDRRTTYLGLVMGLGGCSCKISEYFMMYRLSYDQFSRLAIFKVSNLVGSVGMVGSQNLDMMLSALR